MGREFTFYDYIDADGDGTNIIHGWLDGDGKAAKAYFNRTIGWLEDSPPAGSQGSVWRWPYVWPLHERWKGFKEIRKKAKGDEHRLIGKIEVRDVLLVTWGYHKGRWETDVTLQKAKKRINQMKSNPKKYRREHDNS